LSRASDLLDETQKAVLGTPPSGHVAEYRPIDSFALRIYARCRSLFVAAALLVRADHAEEALIIGRSLFTDALRLMDLASSKDRDALSLGFAMDSVTDKRFMMESAVRNGLEGDPGPILATIDEEARKLERLRKRLGIGKVGHFGSEQALATRHHRLEELWTFEFGHRMTHGTTVSHETRTKAVGSDALGIYLRSSEPAYLWASAAFLVATMIDAQRAASKIFGWAEPAKLEGLWTRAHEESEKGGKK
jgi:hypothetical protein